MIWLLRHADAVPGHPDPERELSERGVAQAISACRALAALGIVRHLSDESEGAGHRTATLACTEIGLKVEICAALSGEPFDPTELGRDADRCCSWGMTRRSRRR